MLTHHPQAHKYSRVCIGCAFVAIGFFVGLACVAFTLNPFGLHILGRWLDIPSNTASADAIVVLGGGAERLTTAVTLYKQGYAPELWYTGDVTPAGTLLTIESQLARQAAIDMGVPADAIHLLPTTSTWEDGQQIAALVKRTSIKRILVVTSWYHGRRGLCVVRQGLRGSGAQVYYQAASDSLFGPDNWWIKEEGLVSVFNEYIKIGFYWWKYGLVPWQC